MANWPLAIFRTGQIGWPVLTLAGLSVLLALTPLKVRLRWLLAPLLLPLVLSVSNRPEPGSYRVTFLDVGQGTSVVVQTHSRVLVYDTGAQFSSSFNAADAVVIPYLQSLRIATIDSLIVSHSDNDHSGGVDELLAQMTVDKLWLSQPLPALTREAVKGAVTGTDTRGVPVESRWCVAGAEWNWDEVQFEFLHPPAGYRGSDNNLSCVLQITSASGKRTLLPGDIEREAEAVVLASIDKIDILMAPHHGSLTSSSPPFVASAKPAFVVYSAGYANRFGFPRAEIVSRYHSAGATQLNTADSGAVSFLVGDGPLRYSRFRADNQKIWSRRVGDLPALTYLH